MTIKIKTMNNLFDIHSHLNLNQFDTDRDAVIARMKEEGVSTITVGVDLATSREAGSLAEKNPETLFACIGQHPTGNATEAFDMDAYVELGAHSSVVAIGECGLDYYRDEKPETKVAQKELFLKHIELAKTLNKPLMIHARPSKGNMDAYEDALDILEQHDVRANFHFFVGDAVVAARIIKNGWTVSYDGPITFSSDYDDVIRSIPIESIMAETDAPFAAPAPYRGQRCEPWMVGEVVKKIAELKEMSVEDVQRQLRENVNRVFGL
jgi:TatD DNase family protein